MTNTNHLNNNYTICIPIKLLKVLNEIRILKLFQCRWKYIPYVAIKYTTIYKVCIDKIYKYDIFNLF